MKLKFYCRKKRLKMRNPADAKLEKLLQNAVPYLRKRLQKEIRKEVYREIYERLNRAREEDAKAIVKKIAPFLIDPSHNAKKVIESVREQMKVTENAMRGIEDRVSRSKKMPIAGPEIGQAVKYVREENANYQGLLQKQRSAERQERLGKLRLFKSAFGLTNRELAEVVGVSERTIFNWLSGEVSLNRLAREKIDKLSRVHEKAAKEFKPEALRRWLFVQSKVLGDSAHDLLVKGEYEKVLADIEALREGVHV
jgi:DNA-binding XRE family transcriptional regulator